MGCGISSTDLYLVTRSQDNWMSQIIRLVEQGVTWVQVREKSASDDHLISKIQELQEQLQQRSLECTLLVNDRVRVALKTGVGVHLGQADMHPCQARELLGPDVPIGWTIQDNIHLLDESISSVVDYVGVGPVFATNTKIDTGKILGVERLATVISTLDVPVVAIGGISSGNIQKVRSTSPWKIAMCAALMDSMNIQCFL